MREFEIKLALLKWLLGQMQASEIIASELQFSNGMNRADLVVISATRLCVYEIKSTHDDFRRFGKQQSAYREAFLDSYLVVPEDILVVAYEHLSRSTGIVTVNKKGQILQLRKARTKLKLSRRSALAWLRASDQRKLKLGPYNKIGNNQLNERELTRLTIQSLYKRLKPRFDIFWNERGSLLTTDDLRMLSIPARVR